MFTPHLVPMDRGILSTCYATAGRANVDQARALRRPSAECVPGKEPFVQVVDRAAKRPSHVIRHKPMPRLQFARRPRGRVIVDQRRSTTLLKGAAGAAVQNFNLMNGI